MHYIVIGVNDEERERGSCSRISGRKLFNIRRSSCVNIDVWVKTGRI